MSLGQRTRSFVSLACAVALVAAAAMVTQSSLAHAANGNSSGKAAVDKNADLTFAYAAGPLGFDPLRSTTVLMPYLGAVYDRLTQINDNLEVEPMLAESWEFSPKGDTLTFVLRDDATFTDGTKIDAAAVKANIDRARTAPFSAQATALRSITNVEAVNPTTVRLTITPGQGVQLPSVFAGAAGMIVNPKAIADPNADLTQGPGAGNESGPYRLESTTLGLAAGEAQFVQRDDWADYWDKTAGRIKRLRVIGIATGAQRINAVRAGDIDLGQVTGVDVPQAQQLVESGELDGALYSQVTTLQALSMKATRPPLDNLEFRQAIKAALDQDAISQGLYTGLCEVSNQDYPAQHWANVPAIDKKQQYNQARAKKLLADSGVTDPNLTLVYATIYQAQAEVAKDMLGQIGINVELVPAPTQPGGPSFANGAFDLSWSQLISIDPGDTMNNTYLNDTPPSTPLIPPADQPEFEPLVDQLNDPTKAQAQRKKVWTQIAKKLDQNAYIVPVCNASQVWLHDGSIGNIDDLLQEWSGLVDFRYLYKTRT
jgi:peptide/nickel transport system substrate-binding protein